MINQLMNVYVNKLRVFNIMLPLQSLVLLKEYLDIIYTMKPGGSLWKGLWKSYKIRSIGLPSYVFDLIPKSSHMYNTRSLQNVATLYRRTDIFKYSFFPSTVSEWNKLEIKIRQPKAQLTFQNALKKISGPIPKSIYNVHKTGDLKLFSRYRLGLSHLNQ